MRTKALLLTAAIGAAGIASSLGQGTVYSVNAVGFINISVPYGFSIIANQLNGTNNNINTVLPVVPAGTQIVKWDSTTQTLVDAIEYVPGMGWVAGEDVSDAVLAPGEGAFILNPGSAFTATLVGEVPQGTALTVNLVGPGFTLISSIVPQSAGLSTMGFPGVPGMQYLTYNNALGKYDDAIEYTPGGWVLGEDIVDPTPAIGQGFFILNQEAGAVAWTRSFSVNN